MIKKADYTLGLKGNQGTLCKDVELFVEEQKARGFSDTTVSTHETLDGGHGRIETRLHWVLDMAFRDDECRIRTNAAPENYTTLKHMALNLVRRNKGKDSVRLRLKTAAWDDEFLASLISP